MREKFIVKVLHHPDQLIPSKSTVYYLKNERLHLTFHRTFVQGILEYFGDPDYDVTPYNQRSFVVTAIPPRQIPLKIAVELIKKADAMNYGDELTNILFDGNGNVIAKLTISVHLFTFDRLDPRNQEHWDKIAPRITNIELEYKGKTVSAIFLWKLKQLLNDPEFQNELERWKIKESTISEVKEFIDVLMLLSDDFVTAMLNRLTRELDSARVAEYLWFEWEV